MVINRIGMTVVFHGIESVNKNRQNLRFVLQFIILLCYIVSVLLICRLASNEGVGFGFVSVLKWAE